MKVLVFSDSHGDVAHMVAAVEREQPDAIFHLGDGWEDAAWLQGKYPHIPLTQVPGNCDFRPGALAERLLTMEGRRIQLCHGHTYGVKRSLLSAAYTAEERDLDLFLFGHTHCPLTERRGKTLFLNPGSIGDRYRPTYAVVTVTAETLDGQIVAL